MFSFIEPLYNSKGSNTFALIILKHFIKTKVRSYYVFDEKDKILDHNIFNNAWTCESIVESFFQQ